MSSAERNQGPRVTQVVLYRVSTGLIVSAIIHVVNTDGTVGLVSFGTGGATARTSCPYNQTLSADNSWCYPDNV
jgi:hypothetical protein